MFRHKRSCEEGMDIPTWVSRAVLLHVVCRAALRGQCPFHGSFCRRRCRATVQTCVSTDVKACHEPVCVNLRQTHQDLLGSHSSELGFTGHVGPLPALRGAEWLPSAPQAQSIVSSKGRAALFVDTASPSLQKRHLQQVLSATFLCSASSTAASALLC